MKRTVLLVVFSLAFGLSARAQTSLTFTFDNLQTTSEGGYEFDVMVAAGQSGTRLGDTQVYINYNTAAFGQNVKNNGRITVEKGTLLEGEALGSPKYTLTNIADNSSSRVSIVYGYHYDASPETGNAVPVTPTQLFHVTLDIVDGAEPSGLSFDQSLMDGQQFYSDNSTQYDPVIATDTDSEEPLPVEMTAFTGATDGRAVVLNWQTASETNNARFEIQRRVAADAGGAWKTVGSRAGAGTTAEAQRYSFTDDGVPFTADTVRYRLRQINQDGTGTTSGERAVAVGAPQTFQLHGAFPNPFRQAATIRYELPQAAHVTISVYDALGRRVATLADAKQEAGRKQIRWAASSLPSGIYFYRITAGEQSETRRMVRVR